MSIIEGVSKYLILILAAFIMMAGLNAWRHAHLLGGTHHRFMFGLCDNEDRRYEYDSRCFTLLERTPMKNNMHKSGLGRRM